MCDLIYGWSTLLVTYKMPMKQRYTTVHSPSILTLKAKGVKISKDRVTVLCCASMAGEERELLVIGKSKRPRCFKNVRKPPVDYVSNKTG